MYKSTRLIAAGCAIAFLTTVPVFVSADALADLQARLQSLYAQLVAIQNGSAQSAGAAALSCPNLSVALAQGSRGDAVIQVQRVMSNLGYLSAESVTGFYGPLTVAAVQKFQCAQGIVCNGSASATGWGALGPMTRARIANSCTQTGVSTPPAQAAQPAVPVQQSQNVTFSASPSSGTAPLSVVFRAGGASGTYYIDFGDGKNTTMASDCATGFSGQYLCDTSLRQAAHTYVSAGTYTAILTFAPTCPTGSSCTQSVSRVGSVIVQVNNPVDTTISGYTLTASPSSGAAPLPVTFNFAAGTEGTYYIDFGDGANATMSMNCLSGTSGSNSCGNNGRYFATHTYASAGSYTAKVTGTPCAAGLSCAQVIRDLATASVSVSSPAPAVSLTVNGQSSLQMNFGDTYTINWSAPGFSTCTLSHTGTGSKGEQLNGTDAVNTSGSGQSGLVGSYTFSCKKSDGQSASKTVTISHNSTGKCAYEVSIVQSQQSSASCGQGAATLSCSSNPSYTYTPRTSCEMNALQNKGWTMQTVSGPSSSSGALQLASALDALKAALSRFLISNPD